jgi:hypothetical protein
LKQRRGVTQAETLVIVRNVGLSAYLAGAR